MLRVKTVKDYQPDREYLVLSLVKKYPLYSLDKLVRELPDISRHSIQLILEKNGLSTVQKRIAYSQEKGHSLSLLEPVKRLRRLLEVKRMSFRKIGVLVILLFTFWLAVTLIMSKPPTIVIEQPSPDFVNEGEKLFVAGKVIPVGSKVKVNGQEVLLNGDGSFTVIVSIPIEESILGVEATSWFKRAKLVRLVSRRLTEAETQVKQEEEDKKTQEAVDRLATLDRTVNDLLAVKNASTGQQKNLVKILTSQIKEEANFSQVVGELTNLGPEEVSWVMITVNFLDKSGGLVDKKFGFATSFGQTLKVNETAQFETQATTRPFSTYSLELSWQEGVVAGTSVTSQATASAVVQP